MARGWWSPAWYLGPIWEARDRKPKPVIFLYALQFSKSQENMGHLIVGSLHGLLKRC